MGAAYINRRETEDNDGVHSDGVHLTIHFRPVASQPGGGGGLNLDWWNTGADTPGFPEGGGVKTFTSTPPPWALSP